MITDRLLRRATEPVGVIDVREPQRRFERAAGWSARHLSLAGSLWQRYLPGVEPGGLAFDTTPPMAALPSVRAAPAPAPAPAASTPMAIAKASPARAGWTAAPVLQRKAIVRLEGARDPGALPAADDRADAAPHGAPAHDVALTSAPLPSGGFAAGGADASSTAPVRMGTRASRAAATAPTVTRIVGPAIQRRGAAMQPREALPLPVTSGSEPPREPLARPGVDGPQGAPAAQQVPETFTAMAPQVIERSSSPATTPAPAVRTSHSPATAVSLGDAPPPLVQRKAAVPPSAGSPWKYAGLSTMPFPGAVGTSAPAAKVLPHEQAIQRQGNAVVSPQSEAARRPGGGFATSLPAAVATTLHAEDLPSRPVIQRHARGAGSASASFPVLPLPLASVSPAASAPLLMHVETATTHASAMHARRGDAGSAAAVVPVPKEPAAAAPASGGPTPLLVQRKTIASPVPDMVWRRGSTTPSSPLAMPAASPWHAVQSLPPLAMIQRQVQEAGKGPAAAAAPPAPSPAAAERPKPPVPDVTDQVMRKMLRQLEIERERRGGGRWR
jgi:hypothetical protein